MCKSVFFMQFYWNNCLISLVPTLPCVQGVVMASGEAGSKYYPQKETSVANLLQYKYWDLSPSGEYLFHTLLLVIPWKKNSPLGCRNNMKERPRGIGMSSSRTTQELGWEKLKYSLVCTSLAQWREKAFK